MNAQFILVDVDKFCKPCRLVFKIVSKKFQIVVVVSSKFELDIFINVFFLETKTSKKQRFLMKLFACGCPPKLNCIIRSKM